MGSSTKSKVVAIAPKFTALLSICGSLGIIIKVLINETRRKKPMHRIMLGMSICDILCSMWYFASTWPIPANTIDIFFGGDSNEDTIFWAVGDSNGISCSISGFFNQFAVAAPLYNISLSVFYLLVVNYGWKDTRIKSIEWSFHVIPLGYAIITSSFAAIADLYGYVPWTCWILPSELFDETQELTPIQSKFQIIQWIFLFGVVWVCIVVVSIIFVIIYRKMKKLEQKMTRYSYYSNNKILPSSSYFSSREISRELSRDSRDSSGGSRLEPFVISTTRPTMNNDNNSNNNNNNSNNNSKSKSGTTIENKAYDDSDSDTESGPQINEEGKWDQCDDIADVDVDVDEMKSNEEKVHTNTVVGKSDDVEDVDDDGADIENEFKKNENETRKREHEEEEEEEDDDDDNMSNSSDIFEEPINDSNEEAERVAAAAAAAGDQKPTRSGRNLTKVSWITSAMFADRQLNETEDDHNNNNHNNHNNASAAKVATARTKRRAASKSQKIAVQGLLYVGAFYVTWLFPTISRITELTAGRNYFPIQFLDTFLLPLQGFFNFFIYIRPRYLIQRKLNQNDGFWMTLRIVAFENHD